MSECLHGHSIRRIGYWYLLLVEEGTWKRGQLSVMSPRCDTREDENSAEARARNILQGAKPGQATAPTEGGSARWGFDALGTQKPVPVSRRRGFANRAVTAIFKRGTTVHDEGWWFAGGSIRDGGASPDQSPVTDGRSATHADRSFPAEGGHAGQSRVLRGR